MWPGGKAHTEAYSGALSFISSRAKEENKNKKD